MIDIALKNVFRQKIRSILTVLGIAMGIGLILTLGSIGEGLSKQISSSFGDMAGVIDVQLNHDADEDSISDDIIADIEDVEGVEAVVPIAEYRVTRGRGRFGGPGRMMRNLFGGGSSAPTLEFTAIYPDDLEHLVDENIITVEGRKIDSSDDNSLVVLMGSNIAESQVLNVGDEIEYERVENDTTESFYFEVIGILDETGDSTIDDATYVPLATMQELEDDEDVTRLKVLLETIEDVENITQEIDDVSDDIRAFSPMAMVARLEETLGTVTMAVYGIAAVSVIVGGIGIMNTMIMSVMERRREIGIMKAIGATTFDILQQVLEESAVLSLIGGLCGFGLAYLSLDLVKSYSSFTPILTNDLILLGFGFSLILGMGAGLYPAWSASQLDPIEVLRYE